VPPPTQDQVFISYSHADTKWREELEKQLKPYLRAGSIKCWSDKQIVPGSKWFEEIESALDQTRVAVLLVTPNFFASDFIHENELGPLLKEAVRGGVRILWVPVRTSSYKKTALKDYKAVFDPGTPLAEMKKAERDKAWVRICEEIERAVNPPSDQSPERISSASGPKRALLNIPYRNPFFTGREAVLTELQETLVGQRCAVLSGLGGVGKTQTVVEYAYRHSGEYAHAFWATADSREAVGSGYATIVSVLELPEARARDQTLAVEAMKCWLSSHENWLLVLDNADDLAMTREFIPSGNNGHVILTTRELATGAIGRRLDIEKMGTDEGAMLLLRRAMYIPEDASLDAAAESDQATAKKIATQLDGLPLALDQAGAYIEETACGLSAYLDLYRKHAADLLRLRGALGTGHPDPVASTWALSFANIDKVSAAAAELLKFCAFLHPDAIPEEVLREGASELGSVLGVVASDELALNRAISVILKYSLLRRDPNARTLEIHRLVQAVLKQSMDKATQRSWADRAVRAVNRTFPQVEFSTWSLCERLLAQAHACAELIDQLKLEFPEGAQLLNGAGHYLFERGRYAEAAPLLERALAIWEKALGPEHPDAAIGLNNLAQLYRAQGRYAEAEPLYQRALAIREKALGPEHPDVATSLRNLAALYRSQNRNADADPLFVRASAIREQVLGPEHPNVASSLCNLAALYSAQGEYEKAESLYQRALGIFEKVLGPEHPDVPGSLNNLAQLYSVQGRYAEAEPLYQRALTIFEKVLGPEHPHAASSLNNLAQLYSAQGRYAEAEPLYQRALAIFEKVLGPEHPNLATGLQDYALVLRNLGRSDEAAPLLARAMAIRARNV